ncbi:hypothetical protein [Streptomyces sp. TLI_171]|uniref:hypothetical protein n=1 Tax=Streptomyces sp. TLI_171 TaxID=1938859 RepID=UPI000C68CAE3|nr:hypothetical protein [Streptomyces sp. TLI_171]RKE02906.1 hypothetical protein BX266_7509 [Streptomyces sp. TLI_171]
MSFLKDATFWTAVGSLAALAAAGLAWWATRNAAAAAADSAATAGEVAQIERDRWHRELTPELDFHLIASTHEWRLHVELTGPVGLDQLDRITLHVRDEAGVDHNGGVGLTTAQREEELPRVIWGPLRFRPGIDRVAEPGREAVIEELERGDYAPRLLELSAAPSWFTENGQSIQYWRERFAGQKLRLKAVCERDGHRPWIVLAEVGIPDYRSQ